MATPKARPRKAAQNRPALNGATPPTPPAAANPKPHRGRYPPPPNETKEERFVRLAQKRTVEALERMRVIGNLAHSPDYVWTQEQATHMLTTLQTALDNLASKYASRSPPSRPEDDFRLPPPRRR